jgi:hypothetical protein
MGAMPLGSTNQLPARLPGVEPARLRIVIIEPVISSLSDRQLLLSNDNYRVTSVKDARELSLLGADESFALALISDSLGRSGLVDAARSVRQQWPAARILVSGVAAVVLEDHLYDDTIPHSCGEQELCDALDRLSAQRTQSRPFIVTTLT